MKKITITRNCEMARLGVSEANRYCLLAPTFPGIDIDYNYPRTYKAMECDGCGRILSSKVIRVRVDHVATGTATPGTGDTVVRRV